MLGKGYCIGKFDRRIDNLGRIASQAGSNQGRAYLGLQEEACHIEVAFVGWEISEAFLDSLKDHMY